MALRQRSPGQSSIGVRCQPCSVWILRSSSAIHAGDGGTVARLGRQRPGQQVRQRRAARPSAMIVTATARPAPGQPMIAAVRLAGVRTERPASGDQFVQGRGEAVHVGARGWRSSPCSNSGAVCARITCVFGRPPAEPWRTDRRRHRRNAARTGPPSVRRKHRRRPHVTVHPAPVPCTALVSAPASLMPRSATAGAGVSIGAPSCSHVGQRWPRHRSSTSAAPTVTAGSRRWNKRDYMRVRAGPQRVTDRLPRPQATRRIHRVPGMGRRS